jgi:hypothetical protein
MPCTGASWGRGERKYSGLVVEAEVALGRRRVDEGVGELVLDGRDPAHAVFPVCTENSCE